MKNLKLLRLLILLFSLILLCSQNVFAAEEYTFCTANSDCTIETECTFGICDEATGKCSQKREEKYNWCEPIGICNIGLCEITESIIDLTESNENTTVSTNQLDTSNTGKESYKIWEI